MDAPLALYRRYRPDTFGDVIGQEQVTTPLSHALDNNRVHHAYLFSGPRGCGKTTSARIMARALNCEKGPRSEPCGVCESCVELACGGPGSIDVIEIDAASHGGVDDARELRERAFFAPVKARYKVYIIDEAHMVSPQGFNALLKLVEEPPSHLRFIFATTDPDKVIGTIKSRTHHYPFRLVPPKILGDYLVELCQRENVAIEHTAVPLVVRAGAGSVRDSLSVLDQLIGGSGPDGVTYDLATALLGYTPETLLDETVDAMAADDGTTLFGVVDKVVDAGQDPRRFAEDLLHRLRDLVVISAVPDAASRGLIELSDDQAERLAGQSQRFGRADLTRAADIVSQGLTDMKGATAPRLLLELMCARILLPGADQSTEGLGARIDRVERRLSVVGDPVPPGTPVEASRRPSSPAPAAPEPSPPARQSPAAPAQAAPPPSAASEPATAARAATADPDGGAEQPLPTSSAGPAAVTVPAATEVAPRPAAPEAPAAAPPATASADSSGLTLVDVRRLWPGVLERVKGMKRYAWILLSQNAQVKDVSQGVLTIGFGGEGAAKNFRTGGAAEILRQALIDELGVDWRVEGIIDGPSPEAPSRTVREPEPRPAAAPPAGDTSPAAVEAIRPSEPEPTTVPSDRSANVDAAKEAIRKTRNGRDTSGQTAGTEAPPDIHEDDDVVDDASLTSHELLERELGARVIDDIRHDGS